MRASRPLASAAAALVLLAAFPAAAAASGASAPLLRADLGRHDGYRVRLAADRSTVELTVARAERARHAGVAVTYVTRARESRGRLQANFGPLGSVSMRFEPSRRAAGRGGASCSGGARLLVARGALVGSLRFRGEGGFVAVDARRAKGSVTRLAPSPGCPGPAEVAPGGRRGKETTLFAGFRRGLDAVYFTARTGGPGRARYAASDESGGGAYAVYRRAYAEASPLTFATDDALSFASVSPPFPFSGTGQVQRSPDGSRSWSGSLAVSFPGEPPVALTGPRFRTQLLRQW